MRMICLEDLTAEYSKPCVLDIKMGNQQQGHDAPVAKAASMQRKCARSTSSTLGFRLCGLKAWQLPDGDEEGYYISRDKQHGRRLRRHNMDAALAEFFCNGAYLRRDVLETVQRRVEALLDVMQEHEGHRFYSASLLVLYEGDPSRPCKADVRLIDFAHTCKAKTHQCRGPDWGFIFGLVQLRSTLARLLETPPAPLPRGSAQSSELEAEDSESESDTTATSGSSSEAEDECEGEPSSDE